jgi:hypothetical protein
MYLVKKRWKTAFQLTPNLTFAQFHFCNYWVVAVHACCQGKIQGSVWVRPDEHQTKYHGEVVRPHLVVRGAHALQVHAQQRQGVPLRLAQLICARKESDYFFLLPMPVQVLRHWNENPIYAFHFWELRGLSPNFHIHLSVSDLYIPRIDPPIFLQPNRQTDRGNI